MTVANRPAVDTSRVMVAVLIAMAPGALVSVWLLGAGVLTNLIIAIIACVGCEALALRWRNKNIREGLSDYSALITAALIALSMPPFISVWLIIAASVVAILLAKHAYGGYGRNRFNPAMAGYAFVLTLYPAAFTQWPLGFDGSTGATALDVFRQNRADLVSDWWRAHSAFGHFGGAGWEWINLSFLGGGFFLLQQKIVRWYAPVSAMLALSIAALIFYDGGSSASGGSPFMHLLSGGTMLGIFFVVTEPITLPEKKYAQMVYGALIGALVFCIRHGGDYSDGIAFAVLLANAVALPLDRLFARR